MESRSAESSPGKYCSGGKSAPIRVDVRTKEQIDSLLEKANKKSFGRKVKASDILAMSLSLIKAEHIKTLQEGSLSNSDRLEILFKSVSDGNPNLTKDALIGLLLKGELKPVTAKNRLPKPKQVSSNSPATINTNRLTKL